MGERGPNRPGEGLFYGNKPCHYHVTVPIRMIVRAARRRKAAARARRDYQRVREAVGAEGADEPYGIPVLDESQQAWASQLCIKQPKQRPALLVCPASRPPVCPSRWRTARRRCSCGWPRSRRRPRGAGRGRRVPRGGVVGLGRRRGGPIARPSICWASKGGRGNADRVGVRGTVRTPSHGLAPGAGSRRCSACRSTGGRWRAGGENGGAEQPRPARRW